jgi:hypothetical protein
MSAGRFSWQCSKKKASPCCLAKLVERDVMVEQYGYCQRDAAMALNRSKKLSERTCGVGDTQEAGSAEVS